MDLTLAQPEVGLRLRGGSCCEWPCVCSSHKDPNKICQNEQISEPPYHTTSSVRAVQEQEGRGRRRVLLPERAALRRRSGARIGSVGREAVMFSSETMQTCFTVGKPLQRIEPGRCPKASFGDKGFAGYKAGQWGPLHMVFVTGLLFGSSQQRPSPKNPTA